MKNITRTLRLTNEAGNTGIDIEVLEGVSNNGNRQLVRLTLSVQGNKEVLPLSDEQAVALANFNELITRSV